MNGVRLSLQKQYYLDRIDGLKNENPAKWWKNLKSICRLNNSNYDCNSFANITFCDAAVAPDVLPDVLSNFFVSFTAGLPALDNSKLIELRQTLGPVPDQYIVSEFEVYKTLQKVSLNKSTGPDMIPNKIFQKLALFLAGPVALL